MRGIFNCIVRPEIRLSSTDFSGACGQLWLSVKWISVVGLSVIVDMGISLCVVCTSLRFFSRGIIVIGILRDEAKLFFQCLNSFDRRRSGFWGFIWLIVLYKAAASLYIHSYFVFTYSLINIPSRIKVLPCLLLSFFILIRCVGGHDGSRRGKTASLARLI